MEEKLIRYRSIIKTILEADARYKPAYEDVNSVIIFDKNHDHISTDASWMESPTAGACNDSASAVA